MNIDLIAYHGFDLDLKSLTGVTKCTTLAQIAYTLLQNSRKRMNKMVELLFLSSNTPSPAHQLQKGLPSTAFLYLISASCSVRQSAEDSGLR